MSVQHRPSIAVFSGKGGVGKSTISAALAQHRNCPLIDCDPQLTAFDWGERRSTSLPVVSAHLARVPSLLKEYPGAIVDTPGLLVGNLATVFKAVDLVLLVTGDRQPELDALPASIDMVKDSGAEFAIVVNRVHPFANADPLVEFIRSLDATLLVYSKALRERSQHYKAWPLGQTAMELDPESAAANEIHDLNYWLESRFG